MAMQISSFLVAGGAGSVAAALGHLGCIAFGAPWYRAFGAGERMVRLLEAGSPRPTLVTLSITVLLLVWAAYAFSGAGLLPRLPLLRLGLVAITAVYLLRGIAFYPLMAIFPGNSAAFWGWSSSICTAIGLLHLVGLRQTWSALG